MKVTLFLLLSVLAIIRADDLPIESRYITTSFLACNPHCEWITKYGYQYVSLKTINTVITDPTTTYTTTTAAERTTNIIVSYTPVLVTESRRLSWAELSTTAVVIDGITQVVFTYCSVSDELLYTQTTSTILTSTEYSTATCGQVGTLPTFLTRTSSYIDSNNELKESIYTEVFSFVTTKVCPISSFVLSSTSSSTPYSTIMLPTSSAAPSISSIASSGPPSSTSILIPSSKLSTISSSSPSFSITSLSASSTTFIITTSTTSSMTSSTSSLPSSSTPSSTFIVSDFVSTTSSFSTYLSSTSPFSVPPPSTPRSSINLSPCSSSTKIVSTFSTSITTSTKFSETPLTSLSTPPSSSPPSSLSSSIPPSSTTNLSTFSTIIQSTSSTTILSKSSTTSSATFSITSTSLPPPSSTKLYTSSAKLTASITTPPSQETYYTTLISVIPCNITGTDGFIISSMYTTITSFCSSAFTTSSLKCGSYCLPGTIENSVSIALSTKTFLSDGHTFSNISKEMASTSNEIDKAPLSTFSTLSSYGAEKCQDCQISTYSPLMSTTILKIITTTTLDLQTSLSFSDYEGFAVRIKFDSVCYFLPFIFLFI